MLSNLLDNSKSRLIDVTVCLALMHWAHMPFWGAVILFVALQINRGLINLAGFLMLAMMSSFAEEEPSGLHLVPDDEPPEGA